MDDSSASIFSPVLFVGGPSAKSRGHDSRLGAVIIRFLLGIIFRARCPCRENCTRQAKFRDVTVDTIVVVVDDQPFLTDYIQTDERRCRLV